MKESAGDSKDDYGGFSLSTPLAMEWRGFSNLTEYGSGDDEDDEDDDGDGYDSDYNMGPFTDAVEQEDTVDTWAQKYIEGGVKGEGAAASCFCC